MTVYLAPAAQGTEDGSSEANADTYENINDYIAPGETIILITSAGSYSRNNTGPLITTGGSVGNPCVIGGASAGARAVFTSNRETPWLGGTEGAIFFQLGPGADYLTWQHLDVSNLKQMFQVGAPISGLTITDYIADNVRFGMENRIVAGQTDATISGFTFTDWTFTAYSKRMIELAYNSHDGVITDVDGDSEQTDLDPIAMGIHFDNSVHDVVCTRVTAHNHYHDAAAYWNGDGFSSEDGTYRLTFIDCDAFGSTDGGWDLKTDGVRLLRCRASDNKRNFRLWGRDVELVNCVGAHPNLRGGTGTQAQIHATDEADVVMSGCVFVDHDAGTIVFDLDQNSTVDAGDTDVTRHSTSTLSTVESNATLDITGISDAFDDTPDATVPAAPAGGTSSPFAPSGSAVLMATLGVG